MVVRFSIVGFLFLCGMSCFIPALALTPGAMPGPELDMLQRMQGQWRRDCYKANNQQAKNISKPVYRRDFIKISYTDFDMQSQLFADEKCYKKIRQVDAVVGYSLVGGLVTAKGDQAFGFDLDPTIILPPMLEMPMQNILAIQEGRLYFGRDSKLSSRPHKLDWRRPFLRF